MDEKLARQLLRQMRWLTFWMSFFGVITLISVVVGGIFMYKIFTFSRQATNKVDSLTNTVQQGTNLQKSVCGNSDLLSLLGSTGACQ